MTNKFNQVIYTGVTSDLMKRVYEHRHGLIEGFTRKYNAKKLVYYEISNSVESAIQREKQIKGWLRCKKVDLVDSSNPTWKDLYNALT